jgi:hypothetical protein
VTISLVKVNQEDCFGNHIPSSWQTILSCDLKRNRLLLWAWVGERRKAIYLGVQFSKTSGIVDQFKAVESLIVWFQIFWARHDHIPKSKSLQDIASLDSILERTRSSKWSDYLDEYVANADVDLTIRMHDQSDRDLNPAHFSS